MVALAIFAVTVAGVGREGEIDFLFRFLLIAILGEDETLVRSIFHTQLESFSSFCQFYKGLGWRGGNQSP